jgi:2'-5' RNA ligase
MFLALEVPGDVAAYLRGIIDHLAKRTEGVRWVRNEGIHITVKFLGEVDESMVPLMHEALTPVGERFAPVAARLGALDAFPTKRSARVIVVKLKEGVEQSQAVFAEMEERLAGLDIERDKRGLVPHITLGRRRIPRAFLDGDPPPIEEKAFSIEHLVLYSSRLTPGGAVYAPIWKIKLEGRE